MPHPYPFRNLFDPVHDGVVELKHTDFLIPRDHPGTYIIHKDFRHRNGLILFYAPWCRECLQISKTWSQVASATGRQFPVVAFNCANPQNARLAKLLKVSDTPTIQIVNKDGSLRQYTGPVTTSALMNFVCNESKKCDF